MPKMPKLVIGVNDLKTLHPDLAAEYSTENETPLDLVFAKSNKKVRWDGVCGHSWDATPNHRVNGRGCPTCAGRKLLVGFNDFATKYPKIAAHFTETSPYQANEIVSRSTKVVEVRCPDCQEPRTIQAYKLTSAKCRPCGLKTATVGTHRQLATTNPTVAALVSELSQLTANDVSTYSLKKLTWDCENGYPHTYEMSVANKTNAGQKCSVCANQQVWVGFNDVATTHKGIAKMFSPTSPVAPTEVTAGSGVKAEFLCDKGHSWPAPVKNVVNGSRCPKCSYNSGSSKGEQELADAIESAGYYVDRHNRVVLGGLELDMWLPESNVGVEYNGNYWHNTPEGKERDKRKASVAKEKGIALVTVWEDDWKANPTKQIDKVLNKLARGATDSVAMTYVPENRSVDTLMEYVAELSVQMERVDDSLFFPEHNYVVVVPTPLQTTDKRLIETAKEWERKGVECFTLLPWLPWNKSLEMITHRLQGSNERVYARKTKAFYADKSVASPALIRRLSSFISDHHVLGFRPAEATHYTWLVHDGEIVSVAAWSKRRSFKLKDDSSPNDGVVELVRLVSKPNVSVVGGASKLLSLFKAEYSKTQSLSELITFSDYDFGHGGVYEKLGFTVVESPKPQSLYVNFHETRSRNGEELPWAIKSTSLVLSGADRLLSNFPNYEPVGLECRCVGEQHPNGSCLPTNAEIVQSYGFTPVYDCGYKKWSLRMN